MELKLLKTREYKRLVKLEKLLNKIGISFDDILSSIETSKLNKSNYIALNDAYILDREKVDELIESVDNLTKENELLKVEVKTLKEKVESYNNEVIKYTANNPTENLDIEEVVKSFFDNPELKAQVSINGKPLVENDDEE